MHQTYQYLWAISQQVCIPVWLLSHFFTDDSGRKPAQLLSQHLLFIFQMLVLYGGGGRWRHACF